MGFPRAFRTIFFILIAHFRVLNKDTGILHESYSQQKFLHLSPKRSSGLLSFCREYKFKGFAMKSTEYFWSMRSSQILSSSF